MQKPTRKATVAFLFNKWGDICLARKKQAIHHEKGVIEYSLGMYNGYGGKTEWFDFLFIVLTAARELYSEAKVFAFPWWFTKMARVYFYLKKDGEIKPFMEVSFFFVKRWKGVPKEGNEMGKPRWFSLPEIPYYEMMPADKQLLKKMFTGDKFVAQVILEKGKEPEVALLSEKL